MLKHITALRTAGLYYGKKNRIWSYLFFFLFFFFVVGGGGGGVSHAASRFSDAVTTWVEGL